SNECDGERGVHYNEDCHECINEDPGYRCICDAGYNEDNAATEGNCIDINECLGERGVNYSVGCHNCINTKGSYMCDCDEGYELHPDGKSCIDLDECDRRLYDIDNCHTCVNLIGGHTCLCNDTYTLDTNNNNETCIATTDPSKQSSTSSSVGIIIGMVFVLFLLIAAAVAAACLIKKRRRAEKNAYTSAKVPDEEKTKPNEYEELRDIPRATNQSSQSHSKQQSPEVIPTKFWAGVWRNDLQANATPSSDEIQAKVPSSEFAEDENQYDEIQDISRKPDHLPPSGIRKKTPDITYYNTPRKHSTAANASNSDANDAVSQSDKTKPKVGLSKTIQPTSEGKLRDLGVSYHLYADDTQVYISTPPEQVDTVVGYMESCISRVHAWIAEYRLKMNQKAEFIMVHRILISVPLEKRNRRISAPVWLTVSDRHTDTRVSPGPVR
ncbi:hypothetical protein CAPTEDRAFT_213706, partial [Capitella teleta]